MDWGLDRSAAAYHQMCTLPCIFIQPAISLPWNDAPTVEKRGLTHMIDGRQVCAVVDSMTHLES
jgi:hypothetical protein